MRIALVHYRFAYQGGLEKRLSNYMDWLVRAGHEVTVIYARMQAGREVPEGVKGVQLSPGLTPKPLRRIAFSNKVETYLSQNHFDFSLSLGRTVGQDAVLAAANHRGFLRALGKKGNRLTDWSQDRQDRLAFEKTPLILAASTMMRDELVDLYDVDPNKIHLLFPPIKLHEEDSGMQKAEKAAAWQISPNKKSFCFVSTSHYRKGLDILLKVFEKLNPEEYELFIAGDKVRTSLPHVHSFGFVKELRDLYKSVDCYIHPARFEPFGQVITEALQCGTPVLISHQVGAKEIVDDQVGKVIESLDWEDWLEAILAWESSQYIVPHNYVKDLKLGLDDHMKRMLSLAEQHL